MTTIDSMRSAAWRLGRKIYCWARKDIENKPETNGEYWLLQQVINRLDNGAVLLDVGANKGDWSAKSIQLLRQRQVVASLHAFEPCSGTRAGLIGRLKNDQTVVIHPAAVSAAPGSAVLYSNGDGVGTNSLSGVSGSGQETVPVTTLDIFADKHDIKSIAMVKVDVEGFDHFVLVGASQLLERGAIEVVQFEYNWRWLINRNSLREVFNLIDRWPYRLGKLVPGGIQFFSDWHFELDRFFEGNYVLVRRGSPIENLGRRFEFDVSNVLVAARG